MESFEKFEGSLEELNGPQQDYTLHKGLFYVIFCLGSSWRWPSVRSTAECWHPGGPSLSTTRTGT